MRVLHVGEQKKREKERDREREGTAIADNLDADALDGHRRANLTQGGPGGRQVVEQKGDSLAEN